MATTYYVGFEVLRLGQIKDLGPYTLEQIKAFAMTSSRKVKFYDEQGFLKGTVYPNGEVQK